MIDKKTLFLDCSSGISGDMFNAMLLDLSCDYDSLLNSLKSLKIDEFDLNIHKILKNQIECTKFDVILKPQTHEHHHHRNLLDIQKMIELSSFDNDVKTLANKMFMFVAEAESKIHGKPLDQVHFHEVGATDSIVDILSAAFLFKNLKIERVIVSNLTEGCGQIECQHGTFPVPAPATAEILKVSHIPFTISSNKTEMITPTGAAILAALDCEFSDMPKFIIEKTGYGAGTKDFSFPNVLRGFLGQTSVSETLKSNDTVTVLETNIDDTTGEELGFCLDELFAIGVLDAFYTPIYMKKNRPAYMLTVILYDDKVLTASQIIFKNTGSIGIRKRLSERIIMDRKTEVFETSLGSVQAKISTFGDIKKVKPEASSVAKIAKENFLSFEEATFQISKEIKSKI